MYKYMNNKEHANYFIDERSIRPLSPVKEEQIKRSEKYGGLMEPTDGFRRGKVPEYPWKPHRTPVRQLVTYDFARRPKSASTRETMLSQRTYSGNAMMMSMAKVGNNAS